MKIEVNTDNTKPLVSVVMITYMHEKFIAEAIEGVLMQEVNFPVELIIADDCSPDGTAENVQRYINEHPNGKWIKYTRHDTNKGMMPNFVWALEQTKGEYIALCEGDDYWTDPYKLQKQVDFLEMNEGYSICFHRVNISKENTIIKDYITREVPETTTIFDLAKGNFIHTPSVLFRNNSLHFINQNSHKNIKAGDYCLHLVNAKFGKIKKLDSTMAVYRIHDSNIWANQPSSSMQLNIFNDLFILSDKFEDAINNILLNRFEKVGHDLIYEFLNNNNEVQASEILKTMISKKPDKYLKIYLDCLEVKTGRYHLLEAFRLLRKRVF
jgi:glycosyltransferase involved in cell wall biosynthesis